MSAGDVIHLPTALGIVRDTGASPLDPHGLQVFNPNYEGARELQTLLDREPS